MDGVVGREVMLMPRWPRAGGAIVSEAGQLCRKRPLPALEHLRRGRVNLSLPWRGDSRSLKQRRDSVVAGGRRSRHFAADDRNVEIVSVERPGDTVREIVRKGRERLRGQLELRAARQQGVARDVIRKRAAVTA